MQTLVPSPPPPSLCVERTHFRQRSEVPRARLYHLPFTRDAASVVSRFMWTELNELRVKSVLKAFQVIQKRWAGFSFRSFRQHMIFFSWQMLAHGVNVLVYFDFLVGQGEGTASYSRQLIPKAPTHSFGGSSFSPPESS